MRTLKLLEIDAARTCKQVTDGEFSGWKEKDFLDKILHEGFSVNRLSLFIILKQTDMQTKCPLTTHAIIDSQQFFANGSILNDIFAADCPFQLWWISNWFHAVASELTSSLFRITCTDMSYQWSIRWFVGKQFHLFTTFDFNFLCGKKYLREV